MKNIKCNASFSLKQQWAKTMFGERVFITVSSLNVCSCSCFSPLTIAGRGAGDPPGAGAGQAWARVRTRGPHPPHWGARHPSLPLPPPRTCPDTCLPHPGHGGIADRQKTRFLLWQPPHIRQEELSGEQWVSNNHMYDVCSLNWFKALKYNVVLIYGYMFSILYLT